MLWSSVNPRYRPTRRTSPMLCVCDVEISVSSSRNRRVVAVEIRDLQVDAPVLVRAVVESERVVAVDRRLLDLAVVGQLEAAAVDRASCPNATGPGRNSRSGSRHESLRRTAASPWLDQSLLSVQPQLEQAMTLAGAPAMASDAAAQNGYAMPHGSLRLAVGCGHQCVWPVAPIALDVDLDLDRAGLLERQDHRNLLALLERLLQVLQHHVVAAGAQFHRRAGLEVDALHRAHLHDAAVHRHFVNLHQARGRRRRTDQPVRFLALVLDGHERARDLGAGRRRARERVADAQRLQLVVVRESDAGDEDGGEHCKRES